MTASRRVPPATAVPSARASSAGRVSGVAVLLAILLTGCAVQQGARDTGGTAAGIGKPYTVKGVRYVPRAQPGYDKTGVASWYGGKFHGRRTASGQRYDKNAMTAAHKTLPFGTRVKVTNLANSRSVRLTINDRGPFVRNRIIDVSRRAAQELGFLGAGVTKVRVQVVAPQTAERPIAVSAEPPAIAKPAQKATAHFQPVLNRAMEEGTRSRAFRWSDPANGRRGSITPLTQPTAGSTPRCRNYRRTVETDGAPMIYIGRACREAADNWQIVREHRSDL